MQEDGKQDMTYGCATITVVTTATISHSSRYVDILDMGCVGWSIWGSHRWASLAGLFTFGHARTRLQHSTDNVCHFFTLLRSSINEQNFGDVSYGSG